MPDPTIVINTPAAAAVVTPPQPGWKSSEFQLVAVVGAAITSGYVPANVVPWLVGLSIAYGALRTALKAMHAAGLLKSIPDLPDIAPLAPGHVSTTVTTVTPTAVPSQGAVP